MTAQWLLGWWNLIFILPFGLGLLYLGVYTISGWTFGDADADAGVDHDVDASMDADGHLSFDHDADTDLSHDVDADADADTDVTADADAHADADTDADAHADGHDSESSESNSGSSILAVLSWLGVGRVPLSIILMVMLMSWGVVGFAVNRSMIESSVARSAPLAILIALLGSVAITKFVSTTVGKYLPTNQTFARRRHELLGSVGEALYNIDATFGMAYGRDDRGEPFQVACRVEASHAPIIKGTKIQLVGYTAKEQMFYVVPVQTESVETTQTAERGSL
jgi:hypothetical protein